MEMEEIEQISADESHTKVLPLISFFKDRKLWWPLFIVINIHILNEFSGISAVVIYATMVLNESSSNMDTASLANLGITFAMFAGNIFCYFTIERFGRRILLLVGTLGMARVRPVSSEHVLFVSLHAETRVTHHSHALYSTMVYLKVLGVGHDKPKKTPTSHFQGL